MKSRSLPIATLMVTIMLMTALWYVWPRRLDGDASAKRASLGADAGTQTKPAPPATREALEATPPDFDWASLTDDQLREYSRTFRTEAARRSYSMDRKVRSGRPVVADIFEAAPGEFVFTRLTPTISNDEEGRPFVKVQVESFGVGGPEGVRDRVVRTTDVYPRVTQVIGVAQDSGIYSVAVGAKISSDHEVELHSSGSYQELNPPAKTE